MLAASQPVPDPTFPFARTVLRQAVAWLLVISAVSSLKADEPKPLPEAAKIITLTIDYGDGFQKQFTALDWSKGATVFSALEAAAKHPRGIKFAHQGKGETVLVTAIDDLKNEGRGRNWLYEVNGKLADKSCGVYELSAGDAVLWRFGKYR